MINIDFDIVQVILSLIKFNNSVSLAEGATVWGFILAISAFIFIYKKVVKK